jgi:hypothetical protein
MIRTYHYVIHGSAADGQTFTLDGVMSCEFEDAQYVAMQAGFEQLTQGKAVFGKPGVGCKGPYDIDSILITQVKQ